MIKLAKGSDDRLNFNLFGNGGLQWLKHIFSMHRNQVLFLNIFQCKKEGCFLFCLWSGKHSACQRDRRHNPRNCQRKKRKQTLSSYMKCHLDEKDWANWDQTVHLRSDCCFHSVRSIKCPVLTCAKRFRWFLYLLRSHSPRCRQPQRSPATKVFSVHVWAPRFWEGWFSSVIILFLL